MKLVIPPQDSILQTSEEDIKHYYYSRWWPVRYMYRKRLQLALDALGDRKYGDMLELGTGGGILLYSLSKLARHIVASDIHPLIRKVEKNLKKDGLKNIAFTTFDINKVPYKDKTFDAVVSISVLEHIRTLPKAVSEIKRVLKDDGTLVIGIPADNWVMDVGFFLIGAHDVDEHHCNTHTSIIAELREQFTVEKIKRFPLFPTMYYVLTCRK